jgi:hypothetical protein
MLAVPVCIEMEEFSDVRFKQCAFIEFLTAEKVPPVEIHKHEGCISRTSAALAAVY